MTEQNKIRLIQNADNRFFYDRRRNMIHDRQCTLLDTLNTDDLVAVDTLAPGFVTRKKLCPTCKRKAAIRNGMHGRLRTSSDQMQFFTDFFGAVGASTCDLARMFIYDGGSVKQISNDCIEIHDKQDTWRVIASENELSLLHNNYEVNDDYSRTFGGGFHVQGNLKHSSFHSIVETICTYSFDYHKRILAYNKRIQLLHFETGLAIANNYVCCDKKSLLFNYYTFIDIQGLAGSRGTIRGMRILECTVRDGYAMITCRIPIWRRKEFESMMGLLKDKAYEEQRFDYLDVCEGAVPQPA